MHNINVALWKEGNYVHVYCLRLILLQEKEKKLKFRYETFDKASKQEALFGTAPKNKAVGIADTAGDTCKTFVEVPCGCETAFPFNPCSPKNTSYDGTRISSSN